MTLLSKLISQVLELTNLIPRKYDVVGLVIGHEFIMMQMRQPAIDCHGSGRAIAHRQTHRFELEQSNRASYQLLSLTRGASSQILIGRHCCVQTHSTSRASRCTRASCTTCSTLQGRATSRPPYGTWLRRAPPPTPAMLPSCMNLSPSCSTRASPTCGPSKFRCGASPCSCYAIVCNSTLRRFPGGSCRGVHPSRHLGPAFKPYSQCHFCGRWWKSLGMWL